MFGEAVGSGVVGVSEQWIGVYGETKSTSGGAAVAGEHKAGGTGVAGISATGIGVFGRGGRMAGRFEGDVEVTGKLTIGGVTIDSLLQRITQLEQKLAAMPGPSTSQRRIVVTKEGTGASTVFVISGSGFTANHLVVMRITAPDCTQIQLTETAREDRTLLARRSVPCAPGRKITVTAFEDANPTGTFANVVETSCP